MTIVAGPGFKEFFEDLMKAFKHWLIPTKYSINIIELDEDYREYDGLKVETRKVRHIEISRGYRVTSPEGVSFALSGDTDYCESMAELGRNVNLMVVECSFPDDMSNFVSNPFLSNV